MLHPCEATKTKASTAIEAFDEELKSLDGTFINNHYTREVVDA